MHMSTTFWALTLDISLDIIFEQEFRQFSFDSNIFQKIVNGKHDTNLKNYTGGVHCPTLSSEVYVFGQTFFG